MAISANYVALVTAVIGIFSAASTFIVPTLYDDLIKNPKLDVSVEPRDNRDSYNMTIRNIGNEPAYDVLLFFNVHKALSNVTLLSNNENVSYVDYTAQLKTLRPHTLENLNSTFLKLSIPRLLSGSGDQIRINLGFQERFDSIPNFEISYVYNNESYAISTEQKDPVVKWLSDFSLNFTQFPYLGLIIPLVLFLLYASVYIPFIKAAISREFLQNIRKDAIDVANKLIYNIAHWEKFDVRETEWIDMNNKHAPIKEKKPILWKYIRWNVYFDKRTILSYEDYLLIDKFYKDIDARNSKIVGSDVIKKIDNELPVVEKMANLKGIFVVFDHQKASNDIERIKAKQEELKSILRNLDNYRQDSITSLENYWLNTRILFLANKIAKLDWKKYSQRKNEAQ